MWPFQDRGGEGIEKNVGINPDHSVIVGKLGCAEDEAFLPGRASVPRPFAPIKRLLDHEQIEAVPFRVRRPIPAAKLLEAIEVSGADRQCDDCLFRHLVSRFRNSLHLYIALLANFGITTLGAPFVPPNIRRLAIRRPVHKRGASLRERMEYSKAAVKRAGV